MNSVLLVLINLDSEVFFNGDELLKQIEEYREKKKLDLSLLTFYSNEEMYHSKGKIKKLYKERDEYPKVVFSKTFTKNDGNLTSLYLTKADKNKEYIYSYMMKYLSKIIDVGGVMIFDSHLKLDDAELANCFGERDHRVVRSFNWYEDKKTLKKTMF